MADDLIYVSRRLLPADPRSDELLAALRRQLTVGRLVVPREAKLPGDLDRRLERCALMLALIDRAWLAGLGRLDRADDRIGAEIALAIRRGLPVLPVVVGDAWLPEPRELPARLRPMFSRGSVFLADPDAAEVRDRIAGPLEDLLASPGERAHWYEPLEGAGGEGSAPPRRLAPTGRAPVRAKQNSALRRKGGGRMASSAPKRAARPGPAAKKRAARPASPPKKRSYDAAPRRAARASRSAPGPGAPTSSALPEAQEVEGRVFARERLKPKRRTLVRFFLHTEGQRDAVREMAEAADPRAAERTAATLSELLSPGDRVRVALTAELGEVAEPVQEKTWQGKPLPFDFALTAPEAGFDEFFADIGVYLNEMPVGRLGWTFLEDTGAGRAADGGATERGTLERYRKAFVSYSSKDRVEVLKRVQGLRAAYIDVFMDLLDLTPGDRYAELLASEARGADLFVLFWSKNAAASEWVVKEAVWAIEHQKTSPDHRPDLRPIILDGPPPAKAPPELKSAIHMNDVIAYIIAAERAARRPG